jgi:hypothetical protein
VGRAAATYNEGASQSSRKIKLEFELHEGHAFWNDGKGNEVRAEKFAEIIDRLIIDFIDTQ